MRKYTVGITLVCLCWTCVSSTMAQGPAGSLLHVDVDDHTIYAIDVDRAQLATNPNKLTANERKTFGSQIAIGDVVSVNGTPVKGTLFESIFTILASPRFMPGQALTDVTRGGMFEWRLDFMNLDGTPIGTVSVSGLAGGPPPPGAPKAITRAAYIIVGGTGAFEGVRGYYFNDMDPAKPVRVTSAAEDPAYRRIHGGGLIHATLYLIPTAMPKILEAEDGPHVYHSDFSLVTESSPSQAGEVLTIRASGLGPTRPGVEPGQPFPSDSVQTVNSPVEVIVDGKIAEVINAIGWPGTTDYRVDFRVPNGIPSGSATVQLSAAWIMGPKVKIASHQRESIDGSKGLQAR